LFLTVTETVGLTAGHTDVSLWYILEGNKSKKLDFDEEEFFGIQWFTYDKIPFDASDPHMKRFMKKISSLSYKAVASSPV
jgi:8-oxo-dGTP diphosphatase